METTLLLIILLALALILVLLVYVVDRLLVLEKLTLTLPSFGDKTATEDATIDPHFRGLSGQQLWDGMTGKPIEGFAADAFQALRPRYEVVLGKHIEQLFQAGKGGNALPENPLRIETLRGAVPSFIPSNHAQTLHSLGARSKNESAAELADALDDVTEILYGRTGLDLRRPFSEKLLGFTGDTATPDAPTPEGGEDTSPPPPA